MAQRRVSRAVKAGNLTIGGGAKISVQSMLNVPAEDVEGNVRQAVELEKAGCEIVRLTVPNKEAVKTLRRSKKRFPFRLSPTFTLITNARSKASPRGSTKSESTPAISVLRTALRRSPTPAVSTMSRFESA